MVTFDRKAECCLTFSATAPFPTQERRIATWLVLEETRFFNAETRPDFYEVTVKPSKYEDSSSICACVDVYYKQGASKYSFYTYYDPSISDTDEDYIYCGFGSVLRELKMFLRGYTLEQIQSFLADERYERSMGI